MNMPEHKRRNVWLGRDHNLKAQSEFTCEIGDGSLSDKERQFGLGIEWWPIRTVNQTRGQACLNHVTVRSRGAVRGGRGDAVDKAVVRRGYSGVASVKPGSANSSKRELRW